MISSYDWMLLQGPGGPCDEDPAADAFERKIDESRDFFRRLDPRGRAKARRMSKRSTQRRARVPAWRRRQRREDVNAQVLY